ncbi:MAG: BamA/TamA family outer membrane protein [Sandaracinaceae bacterium]
MSRHPDRWLVVAAALCVLAFAGHASVAVAQDSADAPPPDAADPPEDAGDSSSESEDGDPTEDTTDETTVGDATSGDADSGETSSDETGPEGTSTDEVNGETSTDETSTDEASTDEASTDADSTDEDSTDEASTDDTTPDGATAETTPDGATADEVAPAEEDPATGTAADEPGVVGGEDASAGTVDPMEMGTPADPSAPPGPRAAPPTEGTGDPITERRARPDLDGLPEPGITPEDALLWIPRIITGPLYLVTEFLIRRPAAWLVTELEQTDLLGLAQEIFTFADNKIGLFPTAFFDFGFVPSFGLYFFWDEFLFEENRLSAHGGTFGPDWLSLVVTDRIKISDDVQLSARFSALRRPDQIFGGIESQATTDISRFGISQVDASLQFQANLWQRSQVRAEVGYRSASFHNEGFLGNPSIGEAAVAQGRSLPDAFVAGYSAVRAGVDLRLDTRDTDGRPAEGVALRGFGAAHGGLEGPPGFNGWFRWGGSLGGFTDILGDDRVLGLEAEVGFISPVDDATVPFTELFDVGASGPLFGFLPGMLRGRSVIALTAEYEWPVWVFLNGRLHFSVGNVFGEYYDDISMEDMRMSFGVGLEPALGGEVPFEVALAFGSETFANGADITSVRFFVGARNGL